MAQKNDNKGSKVDTTAGLVGLSAAAVAAAGAYFLYGSKSAAKNRKAVKSWALKAKAEVLEKLEDAQEMTQKEYEDLIKSVSGAYAGAKNASKKDLVDFTKEMRDHWKSIERAAAPLKKGSASRSSGGRGNAGGNGRGGNSSGAAKKAAPKKAAAKRPAAKKAAKKTAE